MEFLFAKPSGAVLCNVSKALRHRKLCERAYDISPAMCRLNNSRLILEKPTNNFRDKKR